MWGALALGLATFVGTRWYLVDPRSGFEPLMSDINAPYWTYVAVAVDGGQTPYADPELRIEYPPVAWWTLLAPRYTNPHRMTTPTPEELQATFGAYRRALRAEFFVFDLIAFVAIVGIAWTERREWAGWVALAYAATTAFLGHLLYDRLDVGLLMLIVLWAFCWMRSLKESRRTVAWTAAAYAFLGLGISYKLIPILAVPFLVLADWRGERRRARLTAGLTALVMATVLPFAIQFARSGPHLFDLFTYHSERGLQIESLYSPIVWALAPSEAPAFVAHSHGGYNMTDRLVANGEVVVDGGIATAVLAIARLLLWGFLGGFGLWALLRRGNYRRRDAYVLACYAMAGAVILANVLSPQYFIWAIPLVLLVAVEVLPDRWGTPWLLLAALVAIVMLTTWITPCHYYRDANVSTVGGPDGLVPRAPYSSTDFSGSAMAVLATRNFLYLGVIVALGVAIVRKRSPGVASPGNSPRS